MLRAIKRFFVFLVRRWLPIKVSAPRAEPVYRARTIKDTLLALDETYGDLAHASSKFSWTSKSTRRALRRMGPFVPPPDCTISMKEITKPSGFKWPGLVFVSLGSETKKQMQQTTEKVFPVSHLYALKLKSIPGAIPHPGLHYEVGICVRDGKQLFWLHTFCTVHNGSVSLETFKTTEHITLPGKGNGFARPCWKRQTLYSAEDAARQGSPSAESLTLDVIRGCFNFWFQRSAMWQVVTRRQGRRIVFCVDTRETKHYFKDRDREEAICLESGKLRPIIHYVSGHTRTYPSGRQAWVRAHIRGIRRFIWNGYRCNVKTPRFGGTMTPNDWVEPGLVLDDGADMPQDMKGIEVVGAALAKVQDRIQQNAYSRYSPPGNQPSKNTETPD